MVASDRSTTPSIGRQYIAGSCATLSQDIAFATTVILLTIMPARMSQDASQMGLVLLKSSALTFDLRPTIGVSEHSTAQEQPCFVFQRCMDTFD